MKSFVLPKHKFHIFMALLFLGMNLIPLVPATASDSAFPEVYGVAIQGYDPVAYFTEGKAMPGSRAHTFNWNEATWYFTSEKHRDMFAASPQKYAPNHGGF